MDRKEITAQRLKAAMERKNMKARDLVELSGVAKASISQYLHGTYAPSEAAAKKMAKPLEVSHLWLLGYAVAMDRKHLDATLDFVVSDMKESILLDYFSLLNDKEKDALIMYAEFLSSGQ